MSDRDRAILDIQQQAPTQFNEGKKAGGKIKGMKTGGNVKSKFVPPWMNKGKEKSEGESKAMDKKEGMKGEKAEMKYAKGGGIESKGKTKGTVIRMASGGSVSARADGIAQRGKTKFKMC
jgi:hypothetical protein